MTEEEQLNDLLKGKLDRGPLTLTEFSQSEKSILDSFSNPKSFLYELIQNADDAAVNSVVKIKIEVTDEYLYIGHTGKPFSLPDVMAVCSFGSKRIDPESKSQDKSKIGYKGVGFKSVFKISNEVTILSDNYKFRFSKAFWEQKEMSFLEQEEKSVPNEFGWDKSSIEEWNEYCQRGHLENQIEFPWRTLPIYISDKTPNGFEEFDVITKIKINSSIEQDNFKKEINDLLGNSRLMLFLNSKNIVIEFHDDAFFKSIENNITKISTSSGEESWRLFRKTIKVSKNDLPSYAPAKMKKLEEIDITIALSLNDHGVVCPLKNPICDTFSFLPTKETLGFPFIVNSQFILNSPREQLVDESPWNNNIFSGLGILLASTINTLSKEEVNKKEVLKLLPSKGNQNAYLEKLNTSIDAELETLAFIPVYDCSDPKSINEVIIDKTGLSAVRELRPLVKMLVDGSEDKYIVDDRDLADLNKLKKFDIASLESANIESAFKKDEIQKFLKEADSSIFANLLKGFKGSLLELSLIKEIHFLKTNKEEIKAPGKLFLFNPNEKFIEELSFSFLSPEVFNKIDPSVRNWVRSDLGIKDVMPQEVVNKCSDKLHLLYIKERNISFFRYLFKNQNQIHDWSQLEEVFMLSASEKIQKKDKLYLPDCYNPIDSIEEYLSDDICISSDYCKNPNDYEAWGKFFMNKLEINHSIRYDNIESHENAHHYRLLAYFSKKGVAGNNPFIVNFFDYAKTIDKNNRVLEYLDSYGDSNKSKFGYTTDAIFELKSIRFITMLPESDPNFAEIFWDKLFNQINKNPSNLIKSFEINIPSFRWWNSGYFGPVEIGNFSAFIIGNQAVFPSFNNGVCKAKDILIPTAENKKFKDFLPVSSIEIPESILDIKIAGAKLFQFKERPSDDEMIAVLSRLNKSKITDVKPLLKIIYARLLKVSNPRVSETEAYYLTKSEGFVLRENVVFISDRSLRKKFDLENLLFIPDGFTDDDELKLAKLLGINITETDKLQFSLGQADIDLKTRLNEKQILFDLVSENKDLLNNLVGLEVTKHKNTELVINGITKEINAIIINSKNKNSDVLQVNAKWNEKRIIRRDISMEISKSLGLETLLTDDILWSPPLGVIAMLKKEGLEIKDEIMEYYQNLPILDKNDSLQKNIIDNPVQKYTSPQNGFIAEEKVFKELVKSFKNQNENAPVVRDEEYLFETDKILIDWRRNINPYEDYDILVEIKNNGNTIKRFIEVKSTVNKVFNRKGESLYFSDKEWSKMYFSDDAYYLAVVFNNKELILKEGELHFVRMTPKKDIYQILEIDE